MKKLVLFCVNLIMLILSAGAAQHTVSNSGTTFTPNEITINVGDDIVFSLGSSHNALEVSQATYNANEKTSNGGFSVTFGGGTVNFPNAGTYYYVCEPHASMGMKGIIHVVTSTGITSSLSDLSFKVFPNPASEQLSISYFLQNQSRIEIKLINITGAEVIKLADEVQHAGPQNYTYSFGTDILPGVYFLSFTFGEGKLDRKILIE